MTDRPMRDPGRWAVLLAAPLLSFFLSWGEPPGRRTTVAELRADARTRPDDVGAVMAGSGTRAAAWFYLTFCSVLLLIVGKIATESGPLFLRGPAQALTDVSVYLAMFALGAMITALAHLYVAVIAGHRGFQERAYRTPQVITLGDRYGGIVRWAATPSWLDAIFDLWFAVEVGGLILN